MIRVLLAVALAFPAQANDGAPPNTGTSFRSGNAYSPAATSARPGVLSNQAGQVLMESFRCESSNGSATQGVRLSLSSLKETFDKISEQQKECASEFAAVGKLPEIDAITRQIENYGIAEEVEKVEKTINEALTDLALVKGLPSDSEDRALYPDEGTLQGLIANARKDLIALRVGTGFKGKEADRQRYVDGVRQLDKLGTELATALRKNSKCFQRNPSLARQVLTGLVGVSGFFANLPGGIAITTAGRLLQNVFDIADSNKVDLAVNFESAHQTMLAAGLSCSLENLGTQHCRLLRQNTLLTEYSKGDCGSRPCSPELKQIASLVGNGKSAADAVAEVTSYLAGKMENSSAQATAQKVNSDFNSSLSSFESSVGKLAESSKQAEASALSDVTKSRQGTALYSAMSTFGTALYGSNPYSEMGGGGMGGTDLASLFTDKEKKNHILQLVFSDQEIEKIAGDVATQIQSNQRLRVKYDVEGSAGNPGSKTLHEAAMFVLNKALTGAKIDDVPAAEAVNNRMMSREAFDRIKGRLASYKSTILQRTTLPPQDEQLGKFMMAFTHDEVGRPSTLKHLENVNDFLVALPEEFVKARDGVLKISDLRKEVAEAVDLGQKLDSGALPTSKDNVNGLYGKVNRLLDPGRGIKDHLGNLATSATSYQVRAMTKSLANPQLVNDVVMLQNREFVEQLYDMKSGYQKSVDYKTAIALSAAQIDAFGGFYERYLDPAMKMLNRQDIKGGQFSDGLAQNIDRSLKDHFCIQGLALTSVPSRLAQECADAELSGPGGTLRFEDFLKKPHQERVCAYRNFLNSQDYKQFRREPKTAPNRATN